MLLGSFLFRLILGLGVTYFVFEPLFFLESIVIFLGLPLSIYVLRFLLRKKFNEPQSEAFVLIALPFFWTLWDYLAARFSFLPTFIISAGNILGSSPFLGLSIFGGIVALTFFTAIINAIFVFVFINRADLKKLSKILILILLIVLVGLFISQYGLGLRRNDYLNLKSKLEIAVISSDASFNKPFSSYFGYDGPIEVLRKMLAPLKQDLAGKNFDLIILPENMITQELDGVDTEAKQKFGIDNQGPLIEIDREIAIESNTPVFSTFTTLESGIRYKTNFLFGNDGRIIAVSHKSRLTFISEYWPFGSWHPFYFDWIAKVDPEVARESPIWDVGYEYKTGEEKVFSLDDAWFAPLICVEAHYPDDLPGLKTVGAEFFIHTSNNEWVKYGLNQYLALSDNLRKIEAVWLDIPIIINGRYEKTGIITPGGSMQTVDFNQSGKGYGIWQGEVRY